LRILIPQILHGDFFNSIGQKRPKGDVRVESGPPSTADIGRHGWQVSLLHFEF
jgi:hypothetical protein